MNSDIYQSESTSQTLQIAEAFAKKLLPGTCVALYGALGSGKTLFVKGLAKGLGLHHVDEVKSPTFVMMHIYEAHLPIYHFDLYRIENTKELDALGFDDFLEDAKAICCVEWPERAGHRLPVKRYDVSLEVCGEFGRKIQIKKCFKGV